MSGFKISDITSSLADWSYTDIRDCAVTSTILAVGDYCQKNIDCHSPWSFTSGACIFTLCGANAALYWNAGLKRKAVVWGCLATVGCALAVTAVMLRTCNMCLPKEGRIESTS